MHMFEVVNDNNKVVLDDTQKCMHLKYLLKYTKSNLVTLNRWTSTYGAYFSKFKNPAANLYTGSQEQGQAMQRVFIKVPITKRDKDEFYLYSIHFPHEVPSFRTSETCEYDSNRNVFQPLFLLIMYLPAGAVVEDIIEDLEVYVYSSKLDSKTNFGLEIFDKDRNKLFSSSLYYMRVCDVKDAYYTVNNKNAQDFYTQTSYNGIKKMGLTRINSWRTQEIAINGNTVTTYLSNSQNTQLSLEHGYDGHMMYIVSELEGHQDFPVSLDLGEI